MLKFQIHRLLEDRHKSLYWLAKETNISYPTLHKIMNNQTISIKLDILEKLCDTLNCSLDQLLLKDVPDPTDK